ncbi:MAG TPA: peptide chain release factor N(5)-glutamine methyltransferase [Thermoanaerobaculia bacterium]|nr:peptide chain release factor N(5)-glutamine methyltransferase [Thermoanaerobaculia bacterium]
MPAVSATIDQLLAEARPRLAATPFGAPAREAALILGRVLGLSEAQVLAHGEREVPDEAAARFRSFLERRLTGEPTAYLFGEREFYGRTFQVDSRVLIPRPETEHLIEAALDAFKKIPLPDRPWILDVGSGSGILPVTLALEIPGARVVATDISPGALAVTALNARRLGVRDRVFPVGADLARGLDLGRFDLVVSNPPYIDWSDAPTLSPEVYKFEPHVALFAPGSGDSLYARLFSETGGLRSRLLVEIGFGQLDAVRRHARASGLQVVDVRLDYAGIPRVVILERR